LNQVLGVIYILIIVCIILSGVALNYSLKNNSNGLTESEKTLLDTITNTVQITDAGCLVARCFTDAFVPNHVKPSVLTGVFEESEGNVSCATVTSEILTILDESGNQSVVLDRLALAFGTGSKLSSDQLVFSDTLTVSSSGISSTAPIQLAADVAITETLLVGSFTTAERNALVPADGTIFYDSGLAALAVFQNSAWFLLSNASGVLDITGSSNIVVSGSSQHPILDLSTTSIVSGVHTAPTVTFDAFGRATSASSNAVITSLNVIPGQLVDSGGAFTPVLGLASRGITPGTYHIASVTFDALGRATSANSNAVVETLTVVSGQLVKTGTTSSPIIGLPSVTSGASFVWPHLTTDDQGRIISIAENPVPVVSVTGTSGQITSTLGTTPVLSLTTTSVTPGVYHVASVTVDSFDRVTSASSTPVIESLAVVSGQLVKTGTLSAPILGLPTLISGASFTWPHFTTDDQGRIISIAENAAPVASITELMIFREKKTFAFAFSRNLIHFWQNQKQTMEEKSSACVQFKANGLKTVKLKREHLLASSGVISDRHIFIFDRSGSMAGARIENAKQIAQAIYAQLCDLNAARTSTSTNKIKVWDQYCVGAFNNKLTWLTKLNQTNRNGKKGDRFEKQLATKIRVEGSTALYDSISEVIQTCKLLNEQFRAATGAEQRTYVTVLSDQEDNASTVNWETISSLIRANPLIHLKIIHISSEMNAQLRDLCALSRGRYCQIANSENLDLRLFLD
jgi:hypothetical protein